MRCCCTKSTTGGWVAIMAAIGASTAVTVGTSSRSARADAEKAAEKAAAPAPGANADTGDVLSHTMKRLDGSEESLGVYKGKVVLIVNTASKCGLTPQYKGLEELYKAKQDAGLVILGFPANNFMGQEPGTDAEISAFCAKNYGVTFPMFSKISVKGADQHPLYKTLTGMPEPIGGEIKWNFDKFLVDRTGKVVARFGPKTTPSDAALTAKIDELLAQH